MTRRLAHLAVAAAAAALALAAAAPARADGDPASDTLLYSNLFVPYSQGIDNTVTRELGQALTEARTKGKPMRVALIGSAYDLGSVAGLWQKPSEYAAFLGQEIGIGLRDKSVLMVVMPAGFGFWAGSGKSTKAEQAAVKGIDPGTTATDLGRAALKAVDRVAGVSGSTAESPWRQRLIIALSAVIVLALIAGLTLLAARVRDRRPAPGEGT